MIELIYPRRFKLPKEIHVKINDFDMRNTLLNPKDILRACKYKGTIFITFTDRQTHKYNSNYRNKNITIHKGHVWDYENKV